MIIVGAKGFAKEILQIVSVEYEERNIKFFDNVNLDIPLKLFNEYEVLTSIESAESYLKNKNSEFVLGIGTPTLRKKMFNLFTDLKGIPQTYISKEATIGSFDVNIGVGTIIMQGVRLTNSITIGRGCLVNLNCTVGHDTKIGDFVEISPNANISGRCSIGNLTSIGTNAIVLPDVNIGSNCVIGAGTLVLKDVPNNSVVVGVPGKIIKTIN